MPKAIEKHQTAYYGALVANKPWLTRHELADYLGVSVSQIDRTIRHLLPIYKIGAEARSFVFKRADVDEWLLENRIDPIELIP